MTSKTVVLFGAGPGLGKAIARKFGGGGFRVAVSSRSQERAAALADSLRDEGIEAAGFAADVTQPETLNSAVAQIRQRFGKIDVLEFSPLPSMSPPVSMSAAETTSDLARALFEFQVIGAVNAVRAVLPEMIERRSGTILITTGGSAHIPVPFITPVGMAMAACRNYALSLHAELASQGIFVACVSIGAMIKEGDPFSDPGKLAQTYYELYQRRDRADVLLMDPNSLAQLKAAVETAKP